MPEPSQLLIARPPRSTVRGVHHIGLGVADLKGSITTYTQATRLQLEQTGRLGNPSAEKAAGFIHDPIAFAVLKGPNGRLELSQYHSSLVDPAVEIPVQGPGFTHVCYQSPVAEDLYGRFKSLGATPVSRGESPVDLGGYGFYYAYGRDADGVMFEVEHLEHPKFEGPIWISHIALVTHDLDTLVRFYEDLLGREPYARSHRVSGPRADEVTDIDNVQISAAWFNTGNMILEIWQYTNPVTEPAGAPLPLERIGYNKFAFEVADIASDYERLTEAGVQFLSEPVQTSESTEVLARGLDGNLFSLIQPALDSATSVSNLKQAENRR